MKKGLMLFVLIVSVFIGVNLDFSLRMEAEAGPPKEIVIHHIGDVTGPYAAFTGVSGLHAMKDMEKIINSRGGVKGVNVKIVMSDTRYKRDLALSHYNRVSSEKPPIIVLQQAGDAEMLGGRLAEDGIPAFCTSPTVKSLWPPGWVFGCVPELTDQFAHLIEWLRNDWKKSGPIKLGFMVRDDVFGRTIFTPEVEEYIKKKEIDVVAREFYPPQDLDVTTIMTRLALRKPDVIYVVAIAGQNRVVYKAAEAAGLIGGPVLFTSQLWGLDRGAAKLSEGLMEGVTGSSSLWMAGETDIRIVKDLVEVFKMENRPPEQLTAAYAILTAINALAAEVLSKTVERIGWDKLSGREVYKTLQESKDLKILGFMPFRVSSGKRSPSHSRIVKIKNGDPVAITDWAICPDMRPAQYR